MASDSPLLVVCSAAAALLGASPDLGDASGERRAVIFYTAETHGTLEPCGCTSDPLGDFARVTALVRSAASRSEAALLVDAGNLTYPAGEISAKAKAAADLRARFVAREIAKLPFGGSGLGESDLARGAGGVMPGRLAANLASAPFLEASRIAKVGGIAVGVLGVADPATGRKLGLAAEEPAEAATREVARLRAAGAEVVILLAPLARPAARNLARASGADFVVVGQGVQGGMARAERVGDAYLLAPAEELQRVGRLDIILRGPGPRTTGEPLVDAGSAEQNRERADELGRELARLDADLVRWQKDPGSDPAFVAAKLRALDELRHERERLSANPWRPPPSGAYFTNALVPMRRSLPRDPALSASLRRLDREIGAANLAAAEPPPPPEPGRAFYVGGEKCVSCHRSQARFWAATAHAHAWKTLIKVGKQADDGCVRCHVTGYGEVGGSSLGHTRGLENVQCEACHQPRSTHVKKQGQELPRAGSTKTPEAICLRCHNQQHSDTFGYEPYLRGVLGPGHGEDLLDKLGKGPGARELRRAAAARARKP